MCVISDVQEMSIVFEWFSSCLIVMLHFGKVARLRNPHSYTDSVKRSCLSCNALSLILRCIFRLRYMMTPCWIVVLYEPLRNHENFTFLGATRRVSCHPRHTLYSLHVRQDRDKSLHRTFSHSFSSSDPSPFSLKAWFYLLRFCGFISSPRANSSDNSRHVNLSL